MSLTTPQQQRQSQSLIKRKFSQAANVMITLLEPVPARAKRAAKHFFLFFRIKTFSLTIHRSSMKKRVNHSLFSSLFILNDAEASNDIVRSKNGEKRSKVRRVKALGIFFSLAPNEHTKVNK